MVSTSMHVPSISTNTYHIGLNPNICRQFLDNQTTMLCAEFLRFAYLGPLFARSRYAATPFTSLSSRNGLLDLFVNLCLGSVEMSTQ